MKNRYLSFILAMCVGCVSAMAQSETVFAYASKTDKQEGSGTALHETYDIAIALDNAELVGKAITAIEIPVYPSEYISDLKIWIADDLKLELVNGKKKNVVDRSFDIEYPKQGDLQFLKYELETPYIVPEGGTFVGYSLTVDELKNFHPETYAPMQCALATKPGGLYLHTSRSFLDWQDRSELLGCVALTQVYLHGDFMVNAASMNDIGFQYVGLGNGQKITVPVHNVGLNPISSIDYTTTNSEGASFSGKIEYEEPLPAVFAYWRNTEFTLPEFKQLGGASATIRIDKVNGVPNDNPDPVAAFDCKIVSFVPKHLAAVEEYTGTWCGWCARGYVAMELMREMYPDFIGIAYHNLDPMEMVGDYPRLTTGAPAATVNRVISTDPFYAKGTSSGFKMPELYEEYCRGFVPVGIDLEAEYNEDGTVAVKSSTEWVDEAAAGNYAIEYVLLADDVYDIPGTGNPLNWAQHNYYSTEPVEEYLEWICSQPAYLVGLHYNDVAILHSGLRGVEGSIVDTSVGYVNEHTYTFDTAEAKTPVYSDAGFKIGANPIPFHPDKLRVVAMLLDRDNKTTLGSVYGAVVNAAKCNVKYDTGGIGDIAIDGRTVESVVYHDLQGIQITNPSAGVYIKTVNYTDGTSKTTKIVR